MKIVNQHLNYPKAELITPNIKGYIHIGVEIDVSVFPFFLSTSKRKKDIIKNSDQILTEIARQESVETISSFRATIMPTVKQNYLESIKSDIQVAKFDVAFLIETKNVEYAKELRNQENMQNLTNYLEENTASMHIAVFENVKRIAEVNKQLGGIFLFNHFHAEDINELLPVWEYTAGWFTSETGLNNSTLLMPAKGERSEYSVINHCRWDKLSHILPKLIFSKSLRLYVRDNFEANRIASMPILYRVMKNYGTQQG